MHTACIIVNCLFVSSFLRRWTNELARWLRRSASLWRVLYKMCKRWMDTFRWIRWRLLNMIESNSHPYTLLTSKWLSGNFQFTNLTNVFSQYNANTLDASVGCGCRIVCLCSGQAMAKTKDDMFGSAHICGIKSWRVPRLSVAFGFPFCLWWRMDGVSVSVSRMAQQERCPVACGARLHKAVMLRRISICEPYSNVKIIRFGGVAPFGEMHCLPYYCVVHRSVNCWDRREE